MIAAADFNITKVERANSNDINLENIPFGKYFTDHMLEVDYEDGEWKTVEIKPYQPLLMAPSTAAFITDRQFSKALKHIKILKEKPMFSGPMIISNDLIFLQKGCRCHRFRKRFSWKVCAN
jgi:hypothetical protein